MSAVFNERVKLLANALNTLATAAATGGVLAPAFAAFYRVAPQGQSLSLGSILAGFVIWALVAIALHSLGSAFLGNLRDDLGD